MAEPGARRIETDVVVVGAGPAGIAAAVRAADAGARVVVLDEGLRAGGQIWRHRSRAELPRAARLWLERLDRSAARLLARASVVGATDAHELLVQLPDGAATVAADRVILATGARERFIPFPGWTLPRVMGIGGAQALLKAGASFRGLRVVLAGSGPLLLPVAAALARADARLAVVAEQAPADRVLRFGASLWRFPDKVAQAAAYRARFARARYLLGTWVVSAAGDDRVREATLTDGRRRWTEPCDVLCTGYGLVPALELPRWLGCEVELGRVVTDADQRTTRHSLYCAGEASGVAGAESALVEGEIAGLAATGREDEATRRAPVRDRYRRFGEQLARAFALREELRFLAEADTIVCRCEDVAYGRIRPDWSSRQAKLYTRAGMGPCQGRVCGPAGEHLFGWSPDNVRMPLSPTTVATLLHGNGSGEVR